MPKLPENTVSFDNPLRRTSRAPATDDMTHRQTTSETSSATIETADPPQETPVIALPRPRRDTPAEAAGEGSLEHRITVRIDDDINRALELERHERRLAGEKTNVSDVARKVLAGWAKRRLARDRS